MRKEKNAWLLQQKCHAFINEKSQVDHRSRQYPNNNLYFSISKRLASTQSLSRHFGIDSPQNHGLLQSWQSAKGKEKPGCFRTWRSTPFLLAELLSHTAREGKSQGSCSLGSEDPSETHHRRCRLHRAAPAAPPAILLQRALPAGSDAKSTAGSPTSLPVPHSLTHSLLDRDDPQCRCLTLSLSSRAAPRRPPRSNFGAERRSR